MRLNTLVAENNQRIKDRDFEVMRLNTLVAENNQRIKDRDFEVMRLNTLVAEKINLLEENNQRIKELLLLSQEREEHIKTVSKNWDNALAQNEEKKKEISNLIEQKNREFSAIKLGKEKEIVEAKLVRDKEINRLRQALSVEKNQRESIERSLTFKMLRVYQRFIDFILPEGFFVRRFYNKLINLNQDFINNGFKINKIVNKELSDDPLDKFKNVDVFFINHEESRTGAPKVLFDIINGCKGKYRIAVLSKKQGSMHEEFTKKFGNILYPDDLYQGLSRFEKAKKIIGKIKPKLVYVNSIASYEYAVEAKNLGIPVVFHIHELESCFKDALSKQETIYFKESADIFVAASKEIFNYLVKEIKCDEKKVKIIHAFIDFDKVIKCSKVKCPQNFKKDEEILIAGVGMVSRRKGVDLLFEAVNKINKKGYKCKAIWLGDDQSYFSQVAGKVSKKDKNFIFLGEKKNPFPYIKQADVFVLPSREDPFPLVILEAMALGKPVITFKDKIG
jgi:glycosyltransferase involved in cell wall biosynthesis